MDGEKTEKIYNKFNSLGRMLQASALRYKNNTAVIFHQQVITYKQIEEISNQIANFLTLKDIKKGNRIGLYCINKVNSIY